MVNNDQGTFLGYLNWVEHDETVLTTTEEEQGTRVVDNLKTRESDDFWRIDMASATTAEVEVDFTVDRDIGFMTTQFPRGVYPGVSEENPAFAATDTIRYRLLNSSDVLIYDSTAQPSGVVPGYMQHYHRADAIYSARKMIVNYDAISRDQSFLDVGSAGAWSILDPSVGFAYPASFGWKTNTGRRETVAGRLYSSRYEPKRRWSLQFDALTNDDSLEFDEMVRYMGGGRQMFVRRGDLPVGRDAMHCLLNSSRDIDSETAEVRALSMTFWEFI